MLFEILMALSVGFLGIFLGSQITEGVLFVPYWKALSPKEFFELHQNYGPISPEELPAELNRWGNWHWARTAFEFLAFVCSIVGLLSL